MTTATKTLQPGLRARDLRRRRRKTLDQVAEAAEISKGHLSRFERGEKALSVAAMLRLAEALDTSVGTLLGEELDREEVRLVRADDTPSLLAAREDGGYVYHTLSGSAGNGQAHATFIVDIPENVPHTSDAFHGGRELLFVLDGAIVIEIGRKSYALRRGDYLEFPGHIPHTLESPRGESRVLLIVVNADASGQLR